jgi:hypothetical protein
VRDPLKSLLNKQKAKQAYRRARPYAVAGARLIWSALLSAVIYVLDALNNLRLRAREEPFIALAALATIIYAVFAYNQWQVMHGQLRIMSEQLEQMDIAQRPWIRLSKVVPLSVSVWEAGVVINLDLHAKNIGHSPAETVYATGRAFSDMSLTEVTSAARAACDEDPSKHLEFDQSMIFPAEDRHIQSSPFIIGNQEIKNRWMERIIEEYTGEARRQQLAQPIRTSFTVIGCIIYSYRDRSAAGQTAFALDIHRSCEIDLGRYPMCSFDVSHLAEYPADDLVITESFTGLFAR